MKPASSHSGLLTDLYELTMAAGYIETGFEASATFELFVRALPARRNYLIAAGLEQALDFLENVHFTQDEIAYLQRHAAFQRIGSRFFDYLARFRFAGDVWAMPEGTPFFSGEPLLRVTAPIADAQIVETFLLAALNFQTMIASKAARIVTAAGERDVIEFGSRRAHGMESGVLGARAAYIAGCQGTSNVQAGARFGIPIYGTQAHSWIMAHETEEEAFRKFVEIFPDHAVLLLDTYDVRAAVEKIISMRSKPRGVRLDSGDIVADSAWVRRRLDEVGWADVSIFASGDLDENRVAELLENGAHVDGFGVGTALATSADEPFLSVIYKLVELEYEGTIHNAAKFSAAKVTYPGRKQVFRFAGADGKYIRDVIALEGEQFPEAEPLLVQVMAGGKPLPLRSDLDTARQRCLTSLPRLPRRIVSIRSRGEPIDPPNAYPVRYSQRLDALLEQVRRRVAGAARVQSR